MKETKGASLHALLNNPTANKVFSVVIAVFLWFFVVYAIDNDDVKVISDVPVTIDHTSLSILGLSVVEGGDATMTVEVSGKRYDIGSLTKSDIQLRAVLGVVSGADSYTLAVEPVVPWGANYTVQITGARTVDVVFDHQITKEIEIVADIDGLSVPEGYMLGTVEVVPAVVTLRGPERELSRVTQAVVRPQFSILPTKSQTLPVRIIYLDRGGEEVVNRHITSSYQTADVFIPVKKNVELPLSLSFTNIPKGLEVDDIRYTLSDETIWVAAPEESIKNLYEIRAGNINFETLDLTVQSVYTFKVELPEGFVNINNIETVVVEFDNTGLTSKYLNLNNFVITNVPPNYTATATTAAINYVKVVGTEAVLRNIKASDFIIEIDLSDREVQLGQYEIPVSIYAPEKGLTWVVGSYTAVVSVKEG